jgi:excinuclease ABC subunit C
VLLANSIAFDPADPRGSLDSLPESPGIFALYAADPAAEPYLSKTPNLRRRLTRFLRSGKSGRETGESSAAPLTKRLQLAHLVDHIEYSVTGSELESSLGLYQASLAAFGAGARRRLRLRPPAFLRMAVENAYPRVYTTAKISKAAAGALFGPFPSRAAAERYAEEMLNLFLLRRCTENLNPDPAFPGCPYSEMKMCLAPCYRGCTDERYQQEASDVLAFLTTHGSSLLAQIENQRNQASEALEFEKAASLHQRMQKVQAVIHLASEAVRPLSQLSGILLQPAADLQPAATAEAGAGPGHVALFRLRGGFLAGPALYSIAGMRLPNERSGSSSLFAHPVALEAIPLEAPASISRAGQPTKARPVKGLLEARLDEALAALDQLAPKSRSSQALSDHLALFTRWYYSPVARRTGEVIFAGSDGQLPRKALLRAIAQVAARAAGADSGSDRDQKRSLDRARDSDAEPVENPAPGPPDEPAG